jgi:hypothetical protein
MEVTNCASLTYEVGRKRATPTPHKGNAVFAREFHISEF